MIRSLEGLARFACTHIKRSLMTRACFEPQLPPLLAPRNLHLEIKLRWCLHPNFLAEPARLNPISFKRKGILLGFESWPDSKTAPLLSAVAVYKDLREPGPENITLAKQLGRKPGAQQ
jgi:hypothetical protein